jgi:hypothetical protein
MRDRNLHGVGLRDMDGVRDGNRHLHRDLHRVRNFLLHRIRNLLLYIDGVGFEYGYWVVFHHMDRHRDLNRVRNFLLHVYWVWMRDGHFHFFGDGNGLHVTLMMGFSSAKISAAEVLISKTEMPVTAQRKTSSMSKTSTSIPQIVQSSLCCLAVLLLLLFSQSQSGDQ